MDEAGRECPAGEAGELFSSSPKLSSGYRRNPVATHAAYRHFDGMPWVSAGDMAMGDHKGYRYIVGRKRDMVITAGIIVYPGEVEAVIDQHPSVPENTVFGVSEPRWGE